MRYFILLSFLFCVVLGQAQKVNDSALCKVHLTNGSVLVGELKEYLPNGDLALVINENNIQLSANKVKKIVMTTSSSHRDMRKIKTGKVYHRTNLGILSNSNGTGISLNYSALYLHKYWLGVGAGVGIDNYYFQEGRNVFPVFTEIKSFLVDRNSAPYVSIKTGYGFINSDEDLGQTLTKGGFIFNPTFGYRFGTGGLMFDSYIGFRFQKAVYESFTGWETKRQDISWNRVECGIAFSF